MKTSMLVTGAALAALGFAVANGSALADEAPQQVDTKGLPKLGDEWKTTDPFEGNKVAIAVGTSGFNQNCARCHGLEMISGGIAPDLRYVPLGQEGDDIFTERMQKGATRNGVTMMPKFAGLLPQEALWAIRAYMVSKHVEN